MTSSSLVSRSGVTPSSMLSIASHLTPRDRDILGMVRRHRALTSDHVCDLDFDNVNIAQHRLTVLYKPRLLERFQVLLRRYAPSPYHYVLDQLGAWVLAAEDGKDDLDKVRWNTDIALSVGRSQRLAHLTGINSFFCSLWRAARPRPDCAFVEWWSERKCAHEWGRVARPDGSAVWEGDGVHLPFLLEYDRGTEPLDRLTAKLEGYHGLGLAAAHPTLVLFSFPSFAYGVRRWPTPWRQVVGTGWRA